MTFSTIHQVRDLNKAKGFHWFSPDTLRFFRSHYGQTVYGGRYFVSSEQFSDDAERLYTIREVNLETGAIDTVGQFQAFTRASTARREARWLGRLAEVADAGTAHGHAAGTWATDGNTTDEQYRAILEAIAECEFEVPSWLSGEWAGESIPELLGDLDGLPDWQRDAILETFETAATLAYVAEVERSARYHVEQAGERSDFATCERLGLTGRQS